MSVGQRAIRLLSYSRPCHFLKVVICRYVLVHAHISQGTAIRAKNTTHRNRVSSTSPHNHVVAAASVDVVAACVHLTIVVAPGVSTIIRDKSGHSRSLRNHLFQGEATDSRRPHLLRLLLIHRQGSGWAMDWDIRMSPCFESCRQDTMVENKRNSHHHCCSWCKDRNRHGFWVPGKLIVVGLFVTAGTVTTQKLPRRWDLGHNWQLVELVLSVRIT
jgi:hypothetical protein